MIKFVSGYKTD